MQLHVFGPPLSVPLTVDVEPLESFDAIYPKLQKKAGSQIDLSAYDLYTATILPGSATRQPFGAAIRPVETPAALKLTDHQELMLVARHGTTPLSPVSAPLTDQHRIELMYLKYDPTRTTPPGHFSGHEAEVLAQLIRRYGPEPDAEEAAQLRGMSRPSAAVQDGAAGRLHDGKTNQHSRALPGAGEMGGRKLVEALSPNPLQPPSSPLDRLTPPSVSQTTPRHSTSAGASSTAISAQGLPSPREGSTADSLQLTPRSSPASAEPANLANYYRERLTAMYATYNPAKLHLVEGTLKRYAGKEEAMLLQLTKRYGPEPVASCTLTGESNPEMQQSSSTVGIASGGATPVTTPTSTPPDRAPFSETSQKPVGRYRERLIALYSAYNPQKLNTVDGSLKKYAGKEEAIIQKLVLRYGPEPPLPSPPPVEDKATPTGSSSQHTTSTREKPVSAAEQRTGASDEKTTEQYRQQIRDILAANEVDKLHMVEPILERYRGSEEEVIKKLQKRYSLAPIPSPMTGDKGGDAATPPAQHVSDVAPIVHSMVKVGNPSAPSNPVASTKANSLPPKIHSTVSPLLAPVVEEAMSDEDAMKPTAAPSLRSSSPGSVGEAYAALSPMTTVAVPSTPSLEGQKTAGSPSLAQCMPVPPTITRRSIAALAVSKTCASFLVAQREKNLRSTYLRKWMAYLDEKQVVRRLLEETWVKVPRKEETWFQLNDTTEPPFLVRNLNHYVAEQRSRRYFSDHVEIGLRSLLTALRRCIESHVVEVQSDLERKVAKDLLYYLKDASNLSPVTDTPQLSLMLQQAAHLLDQLDDLMVVIRTQSSQIQQLKDEKKGSVEMVGSATRDPRQCDGLELRLRHVCKERDTLRIELQQALATIANRSATYSPRGARCTSATRSDSIVAEQQREAKLVKLQQELARVRTALHGAKAAEENLKLQLKESTQRHSRLRREVLTKERRGGSQPATARTGSRTTRCYGDASPSSSPSKPFAFTPRGISVPRGTFSEAFVSTPRVGSAAHQMSPGASSIHRAHTADATNESAADVGSWPVSRRAVNDLGIERGPCPNCSIPLTSCSPDYDGPDEFKAAFCFSCHKTFSFRDLRRRDQRAFLDSI